MGKLLRLFITFPELRRQLGRCCMGRSLELCRRRESFALLSSPLPAERFFRLFMAP